MTNYQGVGFRSVPDVSDDLRGRMASSPTGRQLARDGSFVAAFLNFDPSDPTANTTQVYSDGAMGLYIRAGVKEWWGFDRANGWQKIGP